MSNKTESYLKNIVKGKRNWYHKACKLVEASKEEDWENWYYNEVTAIRTKDPEILAKILRKGNDDWVSRAAAKNDRCSPEALAEVLEGVLRRGKDDWVSQNAAANPNCPPEALSEVIRSGIRDGKLNFLIGVAARNPNCPPELLKEILRRGERDFVSSCAAENLNCPPREKIEWLEATGQLTKYDPEKFELEKVPEDKDLEELRRLMD